MARTLLYPHVTKRQAENKETAEDVGYYGALAGEVFKKYLRGQLTKSELLSELERIEKMWRRR